jgi:hypothetical protein
MPESLTYLLTAWHNEFSESRYRIKQSESRSAISAYLTDTAKWVNRRATKEVNQGESHQVALRGLEIIIESAIQSENMLGSSVAVQRRNNEVMHRKIAKELAQLMSVATGFYDIDFLKDRVLLADLRKLHATTGTCYKGVLQDLESIVTELEEQERVKQESKPMTAK